MKNQKKKIMGARIFTALFLALCLLPGLGMLLFGESEAGANEILANAPKLTNRDGSFNTEVLSDLSDYIGDRFFLRQEAITAWNGLNTALLQDSPAQSVIKGRRGWLYYADTLADYTNSAPLTDVELYRAARTMALLQEYAESKGCAFVFTLCPNKNSLYDENMPSYPRLAGAGNAERFAAELAAQGVNYLDLFAVFNGNGLVDIAPANFVMDGRVINYVSVLCRATCILASVHHKSTIFSQYALVLPQRILNKCRR